MTKEDYDDAKKKKVFVCYCVFWVVTILLIISIIVAMGIVGLTVGLSFVKWNGNRDIIKDVKLWGYQIQKIDEVAKQTELIASNYDMLVIEPTRSDKENGDFDCKSFVTQLHASAGKYISQKIVVAYVDIGEAEDWRWYWGGDWVAATENDTGIPDFMITTDPDGWSGNYPVAYWDERWKDLMIYNATSSIQQILDDGFDGIYLDWVEGFENEKVMAAADAAGLDPRDEMIKFIQEIRTFTQAYKSDFLVIPQNALNIWEDTEFDYFSIIDAIAEEQWIFDGEADVDWGHVDGGDQRIPEDNNDGYSTEYYEWHLDKYKSKGLPVFTVDYCLEQANGDICFTKADEKGYHEFVSQRSLSQLPTNTLHPLY